MRFFCFAVVVAMSAFSGLSYAVSPDQISPYEHQRLSKFYSLEPWMQEDCMNVSYEMMMYATFILSYSRGEMMMSISKRARGQDLGRDLGPLSSVRDSESANRAFLAAMNISAVRLWEGTLGSSRPDRVGELAKLECARVYGIHYP